MMGYFSSIAKQSGLRFVEPRPLSAGTAIHGAHLRAPQASPLDVEEVVEVPSTLHTNTAVLSNTDDAPTLISEETSMAARHRTEGLAMSDRPRPMVVSAEEANDPIREEVPIVQFRGDTPKGEVQTVDSQPRRHVGERTFVGEQSEAIHELRTKECVTAVSSQQPQEQQANKYLRRTAEIIDGGEMEPAEVQAVLLREIQEWIAAEPVASENSEVGEEGKQASLPRMQREVAPPWEPEPGVVRITGVDRPECRPRKRPMETIPDIQEQVLDLSIGTISVVIEDDKKPPQLAPVRRSDSGQDKRESRRSLSRLSRNYL